MENWIKQLVPIIVEYRDGIEPLDGDAVDDLCKIIKAKINLNEGNIIEEEYNQNIDNMFKSTELKGKLTLVNTEVNRTLSSLVSRLYMGYNRVEGNISELDDYFTFTDDETGLDCEFHWLGIDNSGNFIGVNSEYKPLGKLIKANSIDLHSKVKIIAILEKVEHE